MLFFSQSKIKSWRECKRRYYYAHVLKLQRKRKPRPLLRGTIIHEMIEARIEKRDPWAVYEAAMEKHENLFIEEIEEFGDLPTELRLLMEGYFAYYKRDPLSYQRFNGRRAEWQFEVELAKGIVLKGRLDTVGTTKDRLRWLVEHKSHKQIPMSEFKFTDIQSVLYTWVMPIIGMKPADGVCWDYIRAKAPTLPQLTDKTGEMSRRANIDTTWAVYRQALIDNDLDPRDYKDMQETLRGKEADWYRRVYLPVSKHVQDTVVGETITTAKEIRRRAGKDKTRTIAKHCDWCQFSDLCRAELTGIDSDYIRKTNFEESEYEARYANSSEE